MWRRGFFAESATVYDFPNNDPDFYLSDYQHFSMGHRINGWEGLYDHKLGLRALLLAKGFRQADTVAYIYEGRILAEPFCGAAGYIPGSELIQRLRAEGDRVRWIISPRTGFGAKVFSCWSIGTERSGSSAGGRSSRSTSKISWPVSAGGCSTPPEPC